MRWQTYAINRNTKAAHLTFMSWQCRILHLPGGKYDAHFSSSLFMQFMRLVRGYWLSQVFKGLYRQVHLVAIKILKDVDPSDDDQISIMKEVSVLRACRHSHIVQVTLSTGKSSPSPSGYPPWAFERPFALQPLQRSLAISLSPRSRLQSLSGWLRASIPVRPNCLQQL
jgi:hypothetical protein